ncbi:MAG: T9SS C-terminal target domain-containing protein [Bacteroidetes bacterium]|nr:MAG: T9SS C-terminal target domain-containing protein [Bacteroidota bacterium]
MKNLIKTIIIALMLSISNSFGYGGNTTFYCRDLKILGNATPCRGSSETYSVNYYTGGSTSCIKWNTNGTNTITPFSGSKLKKESTNVWSNCYYDTPKSFPNPDDDPRNYGRDFESVQINNVQTGLLAVNAYGLGPLGICTPLLGPGIAFLNINAIDANYNIGNITGTENQTTSQTDYTYSIAGNTGVTKYKWTIPAGWNFVYYLFGRRLTSTSRIVESANLNSIILTPANPNEPFCGDLIVETDIRCGIKQTLSKPIKYTIDFPLLNNITTTNGNPVTNATIFSLNVTNLKAERFELSTYGILSQIKWEVLVSNTANDGGYNQVPVYTTNTRFTSDGRFIPTWTSAVSIPNSAFTIPNSGGKFYPYYTVKATSIHGGGCIIGNSTTYTGRIIPQFSKIVVSPVPRPQFCDVTGFSIFESVISNTNLQAVYGAKYEWKLFNKGTLSPATTARFTLNNSTTLQNQTTSNVSITFNRETSFDLAVRVLNDNPNTNLTSNWVTQSYQQNTDFIPTDIYQSQSRPFMIESSLSMEAKPSGYNYEITVAPTKTVPNSVSSYLISNNPTPLTGLFTVRTGNILSEGFTVTAKRNDAPVGCPNSLTKTFNLVSDATASTGGYMFDLYSTGMPYRGKTYIRVPAATDPNVNFGTSRFNFNIISGGSSQFTMEAWVQGKTNSYNLPLYSIFSNWNTRTQAGFTFGVNPTTNKLVFNSFGNYYESNALSVGESFTTTNRCYHVAVVSNGTTITFYINGVAAGSRTINGTLNINNGNHYLIGTDTEETTDLLGNLLPIANFVGVIREARLWNEAKSQSFIQTNKRTKIISGTSFATGLVSYLRLNDGAGATPIDLAGDVDPNYKPALNGIGLYYDYLPGTSPRSGSATSWSQATCVEMVFRKGDDEETTPLTTTQSQDEVSIYPNPSSGMIEVLVNDTFLNATLEVYDMQGKKVITQTITDLQTKIDLSNYQSGMYFIKIGTKTFKLILNK